MKNATPYKVIRANWPYWRGPCRQKRRLGRKIIKGNNTSMKWEVKQVCHWLWIFPSNDSQCLDINEMKVLKNYCIPVCWKVKITDKSSRVLPHSDITFRMQVYIAMNFWSTSTKTGAERFYRNGWSSTWQSIRNGSDAWFITAATVKLVHSGLGGYHHIRSLPRNLRYTIIQGHWGLLPNKYHNFHLCPCLRKNSVIRRSKKLEARKGYMHNIQGSLQQNLTNWMHRNQLVKAAERDLWKIMIFTLYNEIHLNRDNIFMIKIGYAL